MLNSVLWTEDITNKKVTKNGGMSVTVTINIEMVYS